ncbi:MAG: HAD family hydrolase [Calditrichaeota bacterium]|nr:HAD family hydrolase [Calditrichota bacterium]
MPPKPLSLRIKVISFDGDGTLWDFNKVMAHALGCTLTELRRRVSSPAVDELTIDKMIEIRNLVSDEAKGRVTNLGTIRLHAFIATLEYIGHPDPRLAEELNALYLKARFEDIELFPDVLPALDFLKKHFILGLLSNGNSYPERCGLPDRFRTVVFSQELGIEKPDRRIFLEFCERAGCEPHQLMHVGDSLKNDVAGANAVGATSVWLNRDDKTNETAITPDYQIRSLNEIKGILV